ncbi:MAG: ATP-binding cassette domain-containing protein [Pirellulaceae bacterium]
MSDTTYTPSATSLPSRDGAQPRRLAVEIANLQHYYGEGELRKQVLFDNYLNVAAGEIVIMTGPSGSGKTTLLTLIGTLRTAQEGSLKVLGNELLGAGSRKMVELRREMGFIFQAHNLFESLTAIQNVNMAMELFDYSPRQMKDRATEMLTRLGLGHRINYKPDSLSGGQKQRVAIARGLAHKPKLILADEPTAALDEHSGREVVSIFQQLAQEEGCTVVMVTHDNRILDVADRIVNMVDGRIKSDVNVKESSVICEFLQKCPVFTGLTPRTLTEIADKMHPEEYQAGEYVIRQGEAGDKFYLIRHGSVDVIVKDAAQERVVATLGEGEFFGEAALLTGNPRNASVVTREETVLYTLGKDNFNAVLASSSSFEDELRKALFERQ